MNLKNNEISSYVKFQYLPQLKEFAPTSITARMESDMVV